MLDQALFPQKISSKISCASNKMYVCEAGGYYAKFFLYNIDIFEKKFGGFGNVVYLCGVDLS